MHPAGVVSAGGLDVLRTGCARLSTGWSARASEIHEENSRVGDATVYKKICFNGDASSTDSHRNHSILCHFVSQYTTLFLSALRIYRAYS